MENEIKYEIESVDEFGNTEDCLTTLDEYDGVDLESWVSSCSNGVSAIVVKKVEYAENGDEISSEIVDRYDIPPRRKFKVRAMYTISIEMTIEAVDEDEAYEKAESYGDLIDTEWNGNSVFVNTSGLDDDDEMTLDADGMIRDISVEED